jgi:hypothetical protein
MSSNSFNAHVVDSFLSEKECSDILSFVMSIPEWEKTDGTQGFWDNRTLGHDFIYYSLNKDVGISLLKIRNLIGTEIKQRYSIPEIYSDHLSVCRWYPGIPLTPHIDDMSDSKEEDSSWFNHREFGVVLYLNDDFTGGETYYPNHGKEITPKTGRLVIHPGDESHRHGVRATAGGTRYTISSFWTQDKDYLDDWLKNEQELYK